MNSFKKSSIFSQKIEIFFGVFYGRFSVFPRLSRVFAAYDCLPFRVCSSVYEHAGKTAFPTRPTDPALPSPSLPRRTLYVVFVTITKHNQQKSECPDPPGKRSLPGLKNAVKTPHACRKICENMPFFTFLPGSPVLEAPPLSAVSQSFRPPRSLPFS